MCVSLVTFLKTVTRLLPQSKMFFQNGCEDLTTPQTPFQPLLCPGQVSPLPRPSVTDTVQPYLNKELTVLCASLSVIKAYESGGSEVT